MYIFFQCVAEAVAEKRLHNLADIAEGAWKNYRIRCTDAQQREEIQSLTRISFDQVTQAAQQAASNVTAQKPELLPVVELYLKLIPDSIRQALKRSDDPTGTTVPGTFALNTPADVARLLPAIHTGHQPAGNPHRVRKRRKRSSDTTTAAANATLLSRPIPAVEPPPPVEPVPERVRSKRRRSSHTTTAPADPSFTWRFRSSRGLRIAVLAGALCGLLVVCYLGYTALYGSFSDGTQQIDMTELEDPANAIGMKFVRIAPGSFSMGESSLRHPVTITKGFGLGVHEVTQSQWQAIMDNNPSHFQGDNLPVENVSWNQAISFCNALSKKYGKTPYYTINDKEVTIARTNGYRLPTEAEWEYACRAGPTTNYCFGDHEHGLGEFAWYEMNSANTTHPVGTKSANAWGLHDMHGNVAEWCWDRDGEPAGNEDNDPHVLKLGTPRVLRGGSWANNARALRSASRNSSDATRRERHVGLRVVCFLD